MSGRPFGLGLLTLLRVLVLIALASLIWVPIGVWIGLRPAWAERVQPVAQFLAAFPANVLFPFAVVAIVALHLDPDIWLSPLMVLGTQWYILFNVIAGASAFPNDLNEAAAIPAALLAVVAHVILPGILPYYVTGALTASGGSWNASIVAEVVSWGDTKLKAAGLGAFIAEATAAGDYAAGRARHRRDVDLRHRLQPAALAAALSPAPNAASAWIEEACHGYRRADCAIAAPGRRRARPPALSQGRRRRPAGARRRRPHAAATTRSSACSAARARASRRCCAHRRPDDAQRPAPSLSAARRSTARPTASRWCSRASPCSPGSPCRRTSSSAWRRSGVPPGRAPQARAGRHRPDRPRRLRERLSEGAVRRHAPAGRASPARWWCIRSCC